VKNFVINIIVKGQISTTHSSVDEAECEEWAKKWSTELIDKIHGLGDVSTEIEIVELKGDSEIF